MAEIEKEATGERIPYPENDGDDSSNSLIIQPRIIRD